MSRLSRILALFAAVAGAVGPSFGQIQVTDAPSGVQAAGLGGAAAFDQGVPGTLWYNPASARTAGGADAGLQPSEDGSAFWLAAASSNLSLGLRSDPRSTQIGAALAHRVLGFDIGIGLSMLENHVGTARELAPVIDLGVLRRVSGLYVGLAATGLALRRGSGPAAIASPEILELQTSSRSVGVGPLDGTMAFRAGLEDGDLRAGGGIELAYWPVTGRTFRVLVGASGGTDRDLVPTLGGSFSGDRITVEYAFQENPREGGHRLGIRWR